MSDALDLLTPDYWLRRAAEMRAARAQARDVDSRAALSRIARLYEAQAKALAPSDDRDARRRSRRAA